VTLPLVIQTLNTIQETTFVLRWIQSRLQLSGHQISCPCVQHHFMKGCGGVTVRFTFP